MRYPGFVPTINLRLPVLSLTLFAHCYPSQTLLWLKMYQQLLSTHMHNWLLLYICRKNTYQSAVIRSISQCLAPKFASLSQPQKPEGKNRGITSNFKPKISTIVLNTFNGISTCQKWSFFIENFFYFHIDQSTALQMVAIFFWGVTGTPVS